MQTRKRFAARTAAAVIVPVLLVLATAGQASADMPSTWENSESYSTMDVLLIFVGIPLLLFVGIATFGWLTHTKKAHTYPIRRETDGGVIAARAASDGQQEISGH
ncbi:hypothetical protein [Solicola gregarius]|uniref:Secreted protein n=1 Tax=Solicola gregarius TaxID=2908642 RepID=A0AA46YKA3_9ACTN|nr:hypothetical protein [Solicola gregarius]UYM04271.1 hypothetical protein L0C25_17230 [Solicola gregarius]